VHQSGQRAPVLRPYGASAGVPILFRGLILARELRFAGHSSRKPNYRMVLEPIQSGGEVIHRCAQFVQIKWLWKDRLHVQPLVGFADIR
jgi:hypothetical protein